MVTENQPDDRIMLEEVPLVVETTYHNGGDEPSTHIPLEAGCEPFILFRMKQADGAVLLEVNASLIESEEELIETLEVFFETMLEDRLQRGLIAVDEMVEAALDEDQNRRHEDAEIRDMGGK